MARQKSLKARLTRRSRSKAKTDKPVYQMLRGIEAKIEYHPFLKNWGDTYQSLLRMALNDRQKGLTEIEIEKQLQKKFNIQWAWADSLATNTSQVYGQLVTAQENQIEQIETDLKSGLEKVKETLTDLEKAYESPSRKNTRNFEKKLLGVKSKLARIERKKRQLEELINNPRLHICWGSKKLFNAQHNLKENGYSSHEEWYSDWQKKRGGNFYSVGKGSVDGNNPVTKIHHLEGDLFTVTVTIPRCYQDVYGKSLTLKFEVTGQRKHDLLYALEANKPVTVQIFRREHKEDQCYIHLSTYIQAVPYVSSVKNGCLGIDLNAQSIDVVYIKRDGNLESTEGKFTLFSFPIPTGTTGQVAAKLRDIVVEIVRIAQSYQCPIACENLDFSKKKAQLRHCSKRYNRMLSGFIYDKFRAFLVARAEKYGIEVVFKNPFATSTIGMIKYMPKYGLNSAYASAMVIARLALGFNERIPRSYLSVLGVVLPEDQAISNWGLWGKICKLLSEQKISRHQMFTQAKVLEVLHEVRPNHRLTADSQAHLAVSRTRKTKTKSRRGRKVKSASL
ncbi:MAG: IS200/IS605 family accessory protein TnpB-related protein [Microcystaceae cyanobacterium]